MIKKEPREGPVLPKRVSNKWPAIMLAARRTARVPGRITFLIVSINTIKGMSTDGVPWGTKWANICWVWLIHPETINVTHKGIDKERVITMCLDLVKTYGNKPKKLLNTINLNNLINRIDTPKCEGSNKALNSLCRVWVIFVHNKDQREGEAQYIYGTNSRPSKVDTQFKEKEKILEDGSKIENKLAIIFKEFE